MNQHSTHHLSVLSVASRYEVSRATIWRWVAENKFPKPIKLSPGSTRWRFSDLIEWEKERAA